MGARVLLKAGLAALPLLAPVHVLAQGAPRVTGALLRESYDLDGAADVRAVSELSFPLLAEIALGRGARLTLSSGYASVRADLGDGGAISFAGVLDTQARLTVEVVPGRLSLLVSGTLPTGQAEVASDAAPLLGVVASDALDFSIARFGSGGEVGGGVVGAVAAGPLALGVAATLHRAGEYQPLVDGVGFRPGPEARLRIGAEGRLGARGYLRLAGIYARRGDDLLDGAAQGPPGDQFTGYASLQAAPGRSNLTVYAFTNVRTDARVEDTSFGPALLPRSRALAAGARWAVPVRTWDVLTPTVEYRSVRTGSTDTDAMEKTGGTLRAGLEYRLRLSPAAHLVLRAEGLTGEVRLPSAEEAGGVRGHRAGIQLEIARE